MNKKEIQALREKYIQPTMSEQDLNPDVSIQFMNWFKDAVDQQVMEPNAMSLATVSQNGQPTVRVVLFKGLTERSGISFYTNYQSRKGKDLLANPFAAVVFCWLPLARQIRIEGRIVKLSPEESESYFHSRPRGSQLGAWISDQSDPIDNREVLLQRKVEVEKRFADQAVIPLPPNWGGYELIPVRYEFWQGNADRLHDRFQYQLEEGHWHIQRLAP